MSESNSSVVHFVASLRISGVGRIGDTLYWLLEFKYECRILMTTNDRQPPSCNVICEYSFRIGHNETPHLQTLHGTSYVEQTGMYPVQRKESVTVSMVTRTWGNISDHSQEYRIALEVCANDLLSMREPENLHPQMLILTPSANSAKLITAYLRSHGRMVALTIHEESKWPKRQQITVPIIVGTPGITLDYAQKYKCFDLSDINVVNVDEVDKLIKVQGYRDNTIRIARKLPDGCNMNLYYANDQVDVQNFADRLRQCHTQVNLRPGRLYGVNHSA